MLRGRTNRRKSSENHSKQRTDYRWCTYHIHRKKDGVLPAYNIRTDRFDIALEAMDKIGRSKAKKENAPKPEDFGNVPNKTEGGTPSDN